jgi:hypothetical protein
MRRETRGTGRLEPLDAVEQVAEMVDRGVPAGGVFGGSLDGRLASVPRP